MKKGAPCERKPAWMPSGKAGADGGGAGVVGRATPAGVGPRLSRFLSSSRVPGSDASRESPQLLGGPGGSRFFSPLRFPQLPEAPWATRGRRTHLLTHLPVACWIVNVR
ncbi:hypothetical protein NN561_007256 [Cricetulus griseus]